MKYQGDLIMEDQMGRHEIYRTFWLEHLKANDCFGDLEVT